MNKLPTEKQIRTIVEGIISQTGKDVKELEAKAKELNLYLCYRETSGEIAKRLNKEFKTLESLSYDYNSDNIVSRIVANQKTDIIRLIAKIKGTFTFKKDYIVKVNRTYDISEIIRYLDIEYHTLSHYKSQNENIVKEYQNGKYEVQLTEKLYELLQNITKLGELRVTSIREDNNINLDNAEVIASLIDFK